MNFVFGELKEEMFQKQANLCERQSGCNI